MPLIPFSVMWERIAPFLTDSPQTLAEIAEKAKTGTAATQAALLHGVRIREVEWGVIPSPVQKNRRRIYTYRRKSKESS